MTSNTQEFPAIAGGDAARAPSSATTEQTVARRSADEHESDIRGVAVLGYN